MAWERTLYLDVLEQCARAAADDGWLEAELLRVQELVRDAEVNHGEHGDDRGSVVSVIHRNAG